MAGFDKARDLLHEFKGDAYLFGMGVLSQVGAVVASLGERPVLVRGPGRSKVPAPMRRARTCSASLTSSRRSILT